jgi:hypothetical protein
VVYRRGDRQGADAHFVNNTSLTAQSTIVLAPEKREPSASRAPSLLSYAILLGGILTIAVTLHMVVISYSPLPYWDGWIQFDTAASGSGPFSPAWLWQQHNEHRLVIPKLFLAVDLRLFQGRQVFLLASIFMIQLLHLALLSWSMWVLGGWRGTLCRSGTGLAAFCLFCPAQRENFIWGFQVCFVLPQLLASLSFVALLLYWMESRQHPDRPSSKFLLASVLAALGATYSLANGNVLWPLLVAAAVYLRLRWPAILSFAITGLVSTAFYLYHYARPAAHADPIASLRSPLMVIKYLGVYFGGSWVHHNIHTTEVVLLAGLGIVMILLLPALGYARDFRVFAVQLVLTMAFCAATATITALGRANFGIGQALATRYQTVALLFWCCLGLLLLGATFARPHRQFFFLVAQLCVLAIFVRGAVIARYTFNQARKRAFAQNVIAASLITGVYDPELLLAEANPQMHLLLRAADYMKVNHLSLFSSNLPSELGKPLESVFPMISFGECAGALKSVVPINELDGPGLRVMGWAWDIKHQQIPPAIVVTTNGVISGLGAVGWWQADVRTMKPKMSRSYIGFVGYLPEPPPGSLVNVYAVLRGKPAEACYLATK